MIIYVDSTTENFKAKVEALQNAVNDNNVDMRYWLEALLPATNGELNPYKDLPAEEQKIKIDEWHKIYFSEFNKLKDKLLQNILDNLLNTGIDTDIYAAIKPTLLHYVKYDTGPVSYKSGLILEKYSLDELISSLLPSPDITDEFDINDSFSLLNGFQYNVPLSANVAAQLVNAMKMALSRTYDTTNPYFHVFSLLEKLSLQHPQLVATLQKEVVEVLDIDLLDYDNYGSALCMLQGAWPHISPYWTAENTESLIKNIINVAEDKSFSYVEDNVLSPLKVIGKGNEDAEESIEWVEDVIAKYRASKNNE